MLQQDVTEERVLDESPRRGGTECVTLAAFSNTVKIGAKLKTYCSPTSLWVTPTKRIVNVIVCSSMNQIEHMFEFLG